MILLPTQQELADAMFSNANPQERARNFKSFLRSNKTFPKPVHIVRDSKGRNKVIRYSWLQVEEWLRTAGPALSIEEIAELEWLKIKG